MQIIAFDKSTLLKLLLFTRPDGHVPRHAIIEAIRAEFSFSLVPAITEDPSSSSLEFSDGVYKGIVIDKLGIYGDGVVLTSRTSTEHLDDVYNYLIRWADKQLGYKVIRTQEADTLYESNLLIHSDSDVMHVVGGLDGVQKKLKSEIKKFIHLDVSYMPTSFTLAFDVAKLPLKPVAFKLVRYSGAEFEANLYQSAAPLPTTKHVGLLEAIEAIR